MREKIINFIHDFYKENNTTPRLKDFKKKDGFPCNKETLLKIFGTYNNLITECGYETFNYGQRHYNKQELLNELKEAILQHRTIDFKYLRKGNNLKHRDVYTRVFGNVRSALKELGITNNHIFLIKTYEDYNLETPKAFLENKLNISYNDKMLKMMSIVQQIDNQGEPILRDMISKYLSVHDIYNLFGNFNTFLILSDVQVNLTNKNYALANDGHMCDSYEEKIIDDILFDLEIKHKVHTKYPHSNFLCDFELEDTYIECAGYSRNKSSKNHAKYIDTINKKCEICKSNNKKIIIITKITHEIHNDLAEALASDCHRITL